MATFVCSQRFTPPPQFNIEDAHNYAYLVVDTSLFDVKFQAKLLSALSAELSDGLDKHINGILIHSDNFGALNLLQARYREQVKCIYIDPPYNTGDDGFIYKDNYQHSTWISFLIDRIAHSYNLMSNYANLFCSIDNKEQENCKNILNSIFNESNFIETFLWTKTSTPPSLADKSRKTVEYIHCYEKIKNNQKYKGELLDNGDAPLLNSSNNIATLVFPANSIHFNISDGEYTHSTDMKLLFDNKIIVENGKNKTDISLTGRFKWQQSTLDTEIKNGTYFLIKSNIFSIRFQRLDNTGYKAPNNFLTIRLNKDNQVATNETAFQELANLALTGVNYPKPISLIQKLVSFNTDKTDLILDYFAGSGTTAHAVINLNREDKGNRQYILVEQGEYFDTVLKPRVQKVIYSKAWKDGKPVVEDKADNLQGVPQIVKVLKLESYEDTLNNLELRRSGLFDQLPENAQHDYLLHYMLDIESRDSLLNVSHFAKPFDYQLKIATNSAGAFDNKTIDLVETFNYLIGATVIGINDKRDEQGFVAVECRLPNQSGDDKTLIFWRDCERIGYDKLQQHFDRLGINPADSEYSQVYVNGDHTLETAWDGEQSGSLKIRSIEAEFLALMFVGEE